MLYFSEKTLETLLRWPPWPKGRPKLWAASLLGSSPTFLLISTLHQQILYYYHWLFLIFVHDCSLCLEYPFPFCPFIELSFISQNSSGIPSLWHAYRPHHLHCTSRTQRINRSLSTTSTLNTWECICISISKGTRWSQTQHERRLQTCSQP